MYTVLLNYFISIQLNCLWIAFFPFVFDKVAIFVFIFFCWLQFFASFFWFLYLYLFLDVIFCIKFVIQWYKVNIWFFLITYTIYEQQKKLVLNTCSFQLVDSLTPYLDCLQIIYYSKFSKKKCIVISLLQFVTVLFTSFRIYAFIQSTEFEST